MIFNAEPHSYDFKKFKSSPSPNPDAKRLPLDFFYEKANELCAPHKAQSNIYLPDREDGTVMLMGWHQPGISFDRLVFDQYTGEVLMFDQFDKFPIGKKIVKIQPSIHYGSAFGLPGQIIYFIACLIATTLPITGVIIWWKKLRNLRKAKNKTE
jgi:uncharacterized iron-regulated membrane protein